MRGYHEADLVEQWLLPRWTGIGSRVGETAETEAIMTVCQDNHAIIHITS